jgi:outer membrane protein assembly factor BamB
VFLLTSSGKLTCFGAAKGEMLWETKLGTPFNSSPSLVGSRVYLFDKKGQAILVEAAREYKEVGRAQLGEETRTCPAFLDGRMYIRGVTNLYCLGRK